MGLASATRFVAEGASVVILDRNRDAVDAAVARIGGDIAGFVGDISSLSDNQKLHNFVKERCGRLDIIFANAGIGTPAPLGNVTEDHFDRIVNVNFRGTFFSVQALLPLLSDGGSIILTGSISSFFGQPSFSVYAASKAAIGALARCWAVDLKSRRIRVNTICPGTIRTPLFATCGFPPEEEEAWMKHDAAVNPLGRNGLPDDIANAALFLASDESSFVTGIELTVDGGNMLV